MRPSPFRTFAALAALVAVLGLAWPAGAADKKEEKKPTKKPQVEVVFCLDTTGSMGGLIEAAKQKIWSISNQIASGKPTPELKVGLVAFRDKGDAYITKVYDLSDDLDAVHATLKTFQAQGGGDAVATPFDKRLGEINDELARSTLVFGSRRKQMEDEGKLRAATALPAESKADRAGFAGKDGKAAAYDLLDAVKSKEVHPDKLKR